MTEQEIARAARARLLPATLAAWWLYLAIDFLLHAVLFAPWWRATEAYWLPPLDLFQLIPFGYASFAIYCAALTWLLRRLYGEQPTVATGARVGAIAGLVFGACQVLATYSVFRMPASALLVWPLSVILGSTAAGAGAAWVLPAARPWRRVGLIVGIALLLFVVGVVLQNLFFPTPPDRLFQE